MFRTQENLCETIIRIMFLNYCLKDLLAVRETERSPTTPARMTDTEMVRRAKVLQFLDFFRCKIDDFQIRYKKKIVNDF